jgi:hypothetical protein
MRVRAGQSVTIQATAAYPLAPAAMAGNPIPMGTSNQTFPLPTPGVYGYFCPSFGTPDGAGMAGAIEVVP